MPQQGSALDNAPGLLDLHGGPPASTGQQLRTCSPVRKITDVNALLTDCQILVDGEGNSTTNLQLHSAPDDAPGLLDMHGGPLANIWQQLRLKDRKALYRTCSELRGSKDLNALLTDCQIKVDRDGNSTTNLQLHWPRHAPAPRRLLISSKRGTHNWNGFIKWLKLISNQEDSVQLLRDVEDLQVDGKCHSRPLSVKDAANVAFMLRALTPSAVSMSLLSKSRVSMEHFLPVWGALRSLDCGVGPLTQGDLETIAQLTQLTSLSFEGEQEPPPSVGCLSALTSLQSLQLWPDNCVTLNGHDLALIAQGCSQLFRLELDSIALSAAPTSSQQQQPMLACSWPSLVELYIDRMGVGLISFLLSTAPQLARIRKTPSVSRWSRWPPELQQASCTLGGKTTEESATQVVLLAADVQCLAAYGCQGLNLLWNPPYEDVDEPQVQLDFAAILQPLAHTLTHLCIHIVSPDEHEEFLALGWGKALAQALPNIRDFDVHISGSGLDMSEFVLHANALCAMRLGFDSKLEIRSLLSASGVVRATSRERLLTISIRQLRSMCVMDQSHNDEKWSEAVSFWQDVCSKQRGPASVRVVDYHGTDWLAL